MEIELLALTILGGFLAGAINTLAGNGSVITLSILTELLGLPGTVANATNRVGVFFQSIASGGSFIKNDRLNWKYSKWPMVYCIIGAIIGAIAAINISNETFAAVFRYLLVLMLFVVLAKPKRWLSTPLTPKKISPLLAAPLYLAVGFYGGFIQMGMGIIFLAITVLFMRYNIINANAMKTVIIAVYTVIVLAIFQFKGLIDWRYGLIIAVGQSLGGYFTAEFASKYKYADQIAYYLLVVVMIIAIASTFGGRLL
jgi:uncharacterized membrane protein YfcA